MTQKTKSVKIELWRDLVSITIVSSYGILLCCISFFIFEGVRYFAILPSLIMLFIFGFVFHKYLKYREEYYDDTKG